MSYYTRVEIAFDDSEENFSVDTNKITDRAKIYVQEQNLSEDLIEDLRAAFQGTLHDDVGFNKMYSEMIIDLMQFISRGFPNTVFFVRGAGEEFLDLWLRVIKKGEISVSHGPWSDF